MSYWLVFANVARNSVIPLVPRCVCVNRENRFVITNGMTKVILRCIASLVNMIYLRANSCSANRCFPGPAAIFPFRRTKKSIRRLADKAFPPKQINSPMVIYGVTPNHHTASHAHPH